MMVRAVSVFAPEDEGIAIGQRRDCSCQHAVEGAGAEEGPRTNVLVAARRS